MYFALGKLTVFIKGIEVAISNVTGDEICVSYINVTKAKGQSRSAHGPSVSDMGQSRHEGSRRLLYWFSFKNEHINDLEVKEVKMRHVKHDSRCIL